MQYQFIHLYTYERSINYGTIDLENFYLDMAHIKKNNPDITVFLLHVFENIIFDKVNQFAIETFRRILEELDLKYYFVFDNFNSHHFLNKKNIVSLNWGLFYTYYNIFYKNHPVIHQYKPQSSKGLYLMGKAEKLHRIGLLKKFYEKNELNRIVWSFVNSQKNIEDMKEKFFPEYTVDQYQNFLKTCIRELDYTPVYTNNKYQFDHPGFGFPTDIGLYENTGFSIISESWAGPHPYHLITEKTWRAIANKHPFILLANPLNDVKLVSCGFKTYKEYLKIPYYNSIKDTPVKIDAVVDNTIHLVNCLESDCWPHKNSIVEDTEKNYAKFISLAKTEIDNFLLDTGTDESIFSGIIEFHKEFQPYKRNNKTPTPIKPLNG